MKYLLAILLFQLTLTSTMYERNNTAPLASQKRNLVLSGNVLSNQLSGNKNTTIVNKKDHIINSNNTDHSTVLNRNSYNKVSKITKSGNVNKQINKGAINIGNKQFSSSFPLNPHNNSTVFRKNLKDIMHNSLYHNSESNIVKPLDLKNIDHFIHRHLKNK